MQSQALLFRYDIAEIRVATIKIYIKIIHTSGGIDDWSNNSELDWVAINSLLWQIFSWLVTITGEPSARIAIDRWVKNEKLGCCQNSGINGFRILSFPKKEVSRENVENNRGRIWKTVEKFP